ncbi:MAG: TldD/PmbA family protein [Deltaproteobacteria bacterium]|nr:MAG: TldD/PmbA family protein [Deltaproteobacteria bacterium]
MDLEEMARALVAEALAAGARAVDAVVAESDGLGVGVRLREVEKVKRARQRRAGLRVFFGESTAVASTADLTGEGLSTLARDACTLARGTAPDPYAGLPDPAELARDWPDLDLYDSALEALDPSQALTWTREAEAAALDAAPEITNSEGAEFSSSVGQVAYASSLGFTGVYRGSHASLSVVPVATRDGAMQRDAWFTAHRKLAGLESPASVGGEAARRTLRRLGARRAPTRECPVVFDPETAATLLRHLAGALAGPALYSARRLGLRPTGHATRSVGDVPSAAPTNFFVEPGPYSPEAIIASVREGLYVTELIGFGVNPVTGDYSRGAVGLWIENGELAYPVEEITIAGNLSDMLRDVEMVGNDLRLRTALAAPTLKIARMTVAGT